jgi:23S rRNA (guanosine2251-2'-O)-methyltransferase
MAATGAAERLTELAAALDGPVPPVEIVDRRDLEAVLPPGAVHQGVVVQADPLPAIDLKAFLEDLAEVPEIRLVVLDQASDPRNIGAVLRSAAAFGARAVIMQDRHAPDATAALAKAASGALETVPLVRVVNVARALRGLKEAGFWLIGLDGAAELPLAGADPGGRVALVLGAEGGGLRRLTREACDALVRIPIGPAVESLNLSTAAAIALYELARDPS